MKNVTKTNILFTFMVIFYMLLIFTVRLIPVNIIGINARLILPELIMLIPAIIYVSVLKPDNLGQLSFGILPVKEYILTAVITICLIPAISLINSLSYVFVTNQASEMLYSLTPNPLWVNVILLALVPAVVEEYLFRGLILNGYKKRNPFGAVMMSSLLFGLIHMNINQFIYAFVMGVIFSLMVYATGTVTSSMTAHFVFNAYNVIMSYNAAKILENTKDVATDITTDITMGMYVQAIATLVIIGAIGAFIAYRLFKTLCEKNRGFNNLMLIFKKQNRKYYDQSQGSFFDGYIILGILICIIYMLVYGR